MEQVDLNPNGSLDFGASFTNTRPDGLRRCTRFVQKSLLGGFSSELSSYGVICPVKCFIKVLKGESLVRILMKHWFFSFDRIYILWY